MVEERSRWDELPEEMIMAIFKQAPWDLLFQMEVVSQRCRRLALEEKRNRLRPFIPEVSEHLPELWKAAKDLRLLLKTLEKIPNLILKKVESIDSS